MSCETFIRIWAVREVAPQHKSKCQLFIPRCAYSEAGMTPREEFVGTKDAKGIEILRDKAELFDYLMAVDYARLALRNVSGFLRLRNKDIQLAVIAGGFVD